MTKTHAIVHSRPKLSSLPIQTNDEIITLTPHWYANSSVWLNLFVMAASVSAIGTTVAIAVHKFSPVELQNNSNTSRNETAYQTRFFNTPGIRENPPASYKKEVYFTTDTIVILQFQPLHCNTTTDDAILAREHLNCGQSRSSLFLIRYSNITSIENSQNYDLKQIEFQPQISFNHNEFKRLPSDEIQQTYIIIMSDVDDSINSPIQYWILTINEKTNNHKDICSYKTPYLYTPPHRYVFLLYTTSLKNLELSNNLCNQSNKFPLNKIINDNQLKLLASIYFLSQKNIIPAFIDEK